jgi:hypothetical protein
MAYVALISWFVTLLPGLYMLTVWLIENDVTDRNAPASRLPTPLIFTHLTLAVTGFVVWVGYVLSDRDVLAWTALALIGLVDVLGLTMFRRWIPVYREPVVPAAERILPAAQVSPPEGSFPVVVVAGHGLLAFSTAVLVLLATLDVDIHF